MILNTSIARLCAVLAAAAAIGGCASPAVRLMPTPVLFAGGDAQPVGIVAEAGRDSTIEILYATNREPAGTPDERRYTRRSDDRLHLGVATLRVGDGTKTPESLHAMSTSAREGERPAITLQSMREMAVLDEGVATSGPDVEAFFAYVDALLGRTGKRDLLIYVHGANTNVERAAAQAAQFQHFMGRDAVVMVFAWPSAGRLLQYRRDVAMARRSEPGFARLLERLSADTQASVNVLAYSAGAMVTSPGLARAAAAAGTEDGALRLGEVYYAAPDIDFPVFVANLPRYQGPVRRVTVAVNMDDSVLSWTHRLHRVSRAGRPNLADIGPEETDWLVAASGRDELDVLSIRPDDLPGLPQGSHAFWYDHPWVSSDVLLKLRFHAPPPARGLQHDRTGIGLAFWTFPADYAARLPVVAQALSAGNAP